jgi:hypothetical protein
VGNGSELTEAAAAASKTLAILPRAAKKGRSRWIDERARCIFQAVPNAAAHALAGDDVRLSEGCCHKAKCHGETNAHQTNPSF